jgi:hypothetical protein
MRRVVVSAAAVATATVVGVAVDAVPADSVVVFASGAVDGVVSGWNGMSRE